MYIARKVAAHFATFIVFDSKVILKLSFLRNEFQETQKEQAWTILIYAIYELNRCVVKESNKSIYRINDIGLVRLPATQVKKPKSYFQWLNCVYRLY